MLHADVHSVLNNTEIRIFVFVTVMDVHENHNRSPISQINGQTLKCSLQRRHESQENPSVNKSMNDQGERWLFEKKPKLL